jgi:prevent-host-death family protein
MSIMTLPVSEAKQRFTDLVRGSEELFDRYLITRNGKEAALLMSAEEYSSLLETLDILSNGREVRALAKGMEDARRRRTLPLEKYLARKGRTQKRNGKPRRVRGKR